MVLLGTPTLLVNLGKLHEQSSSGASMTVHWKPLFKIIGILLVLIFVGIGTYRNFQLENELIDLKSIVSWGGTGATVNTAVLNPYKKSHKAMLIFRLEVRSVDYLTDRDIVKSYFFDIDGELHPVDVTIPDTFRNREPSSTGFVQAYLVVVPKTISSDDIMRLADVKTNGGHIIATRGSRAFLIMKRQKDADKKDVSSSH